MLSKNCAAFTISIITLKKRLFIFLKKLFKNHILSDKKWGHFSRGSPFKGFFFNMLLANKILKIPIFVESPKIHCSFEQINSLFVKNHTLYYASLSLYIYFWLSTSQILYLYLRLFNSQPLCLYFTSLHQPRPLSHSTSP